MVSLETEPNISIFPKAVNMTGRNLEKLPRFLWDLRLPARRLVKEGDWVRFYVHLATTDMEARLDCGSQFINDMRCTLKGVKLIRVCRLGGSIPSFTLSH